LLSKKECEQASERFNLRRKKNCEELSYKLELKSRRKVKIIPRKVCHNPGEKKK
jgi:hypothetical protein